MHILSDSFNTHLRKINFMHALPRVLIDSREKGSVKV